ncbi:GIN domain-containing protein [Aquiflexum lacus]|uniref:GIN domain-containing protein n=1 Tax=Aquiflexum lacus TaxID=2483805 RepID=UPI00189486BE|nr:DUF2807 domain-containing protein [Aquiflexum lacus]
MLSSHEQFKIHHPFLIPFSLSQTDLGDFKGEEVSVEEATIKKTGSGQTQIGAVESLNVRATGSGNVYYAGNPGNRNISSTGSAKVIKR